MITEIVMVYFDDLDAMGVVHNGRYATLLERALAAYWTQAGWSYDPGHPRFAEVLFVVREFAITYHAPITRIGAVRVQLWLDHLGNTSAVYGFRVRSDDGAVLHAEGRRVQVRLDPATLRPARFGAELREAFRPLLAREEVGAKDALPDRSFDVVGSTLAAHHIPGTAHQDAFGEMLRVLRPGGALLVADFRPSRRRRSLHSRVTASRHGSAVPLEDLAVAAGFRIEAGDDLPLLRYFQAIRPGAS